jgi:hypothetical protein
MEPVIARPAIDHRIHRHRDFQCRLRIRQRHRRFKAVVASPCDSGCNVCTSRVLRRQISQKANAARNDLYRCRKPSSRSFGRRRSHIAFESSKSWGHDLELCCFL